MSKVLALMEQRRNEEVVEDGLRGKEALWYFLHALTAHPILQPGGFAILKAPSVADPLLKEHYYVTRPDEPWQHGQQSYRRLLLTLGPHGLIRVFATLLLEKRIILSASQPATLALHCQALLSLLYPLEWHHTHVPILPRGLEDLCCSPTPYVLGVLSDALPLVLDLPHESVCLVDLDTGAMRYTDPADNDPPSAPPFRALLRNIDSIHKRLRHEGGQLLSRGSHSSE